MLTLRVRTGSLRPFWRISKRFFQDPERLKQYRLENKESIQEQQRRYRLENQESIREQQRKYRLENQESIRERQRKYRLENKEKQKQYYLEHKESIQEQRKQYRLENRESLNEKQRKYHLQNKDLLNEKQRKYHLQNKDLINQKKRHYHLTNKDVINEKKRHYHLKNRDSINEEKRKQYLQQNPPRAIPDWDDPQVVRKALDKASILLGIEHPDDWYRVCTNLFFFLKQRPLYLKFGSWHKLLQFGYPEHDWDAIRLTSGSKRSIQRWLGLKITELLPGTEIFEEFYHPDLFWNGASGQNIQLDLWIPDFDIAFEYQGQQHYSDSTVFGAIADISSLRDAKKKQICSNHGITVIPIPYWWDKKIESLAATAHQYRPDVFPFTQGSPIPVDPPLTKKQRSMYPLMLGTEWGLEEDPTGYFLSEKLNGFRAYWDGHTLFSRSGHSISIPSTMRSLLPDVHLDGELWLGYGLESFDELKSVIGIPLIRDQISHEQQILDLWEGIKFCVFDAPQQLLSYPERHKFITTVVPETEYTHVVPVVLCEVCFSLILIIIINLINVPRVKIISKLFLTK